MVAREVSRRSTYLVGAVALAIAGISIYALVRDRDQTAPSPVRPQTFEVFDLSGIPRTIAVTSDAVWVTLGDRSIVKLDPEDGRHLRRTRLPFLPGQVLAAHGDVWVGAIEGDTIVRVDADTARIVQRIEIGTTPQSLAADDSAVFVSAFDEGLVRPVDPGTNTAGRPVFRSEDAFPSAITAAFDSLWVTDVVRDVVTRITGDGREISVPVGNSPTDVVAAYGRLWVANFNERSVSTIDPATDEGGPSIAVGAKPGQMAAAGGFVWVLRPGSDSFVGIDAEAGRWTGDVYEVGDTPQDIAAGLGALWIVSQDSSLTRVPID